MSCKCAAGPALTNEDWLSGTLVKRYPYHSAVAIRVLQNCGYSLDVHQAAQDACQTAALRLYRVLKSGAKCRCQLELSYTGRAVRNEALTLVRHSRRDGLSQARPLDDFPQLIATGTDAFRSTLATELMADMDAEVREFAWEGLSAKQIVESAPRETATPCTVKEIYRKWDLYRVHALGRLRVADASHGSATRVRRGPVKDGGSTVPSQPAKAA